VRAAVFAILALTVGSGSASAEPFFLRGADGDAGPEGARGPAGDPELVCDEDTCTLRQDLEVSGPGAFDSIAADEALIGSLDTDALTVSMSIWMPECPSGYTRDATVDDFILCTDGLDQMVKVGDFWIDRFESSVWSSSSCLGTQYGDSPDWSTVSAVFPYHGGFTAPLFACSVTGVPPSRWLTWFQAQSACAASGKHLVTNAEWQAAVAGTEDADGCLVSSDGPRSTGDGTCVSSWGAEDMIGNLWEWTADWYGQGQDSAHGAQPPEYSFDAYWNVDAAQFQGPYATAFPAAGIRGGGWSDSDLAGAFTVSLQHAPSFSSDGIGFRCAMH